MMSSLFTKRYVEKRYITYSRVKIDTTDATIKWVSLVMNGSKLLKATEIADKVNQLKREMDKHIRDPKYPHHVSIAKLHRLDPKQLDTTLLGLILNYGV